jgi:hypothetical protein
VFAVRGFFPALHYAFVALDQRHGFVAQRYHVHTPA